MESPSDLLELFHVYGVSVGGQIINVGAMDQPNPLAESRQDNSRYRLLIEAVTDYAIYMLDPSGIVSSWNPGAERFKGYAASEIIGQHFSRFYSEEDRKAGLPARALRTAAHEGRFVSEG